MDLRDRDLVSIQEARNLVAGAAAAQKKFRSFSQQQVDAVVDTCAAACLNAAESLARAAVEETGFGNVPDKTTKNTFTATYVPRAMAGMRTIGAIREDREKQIIEIASPVGVVAAVIPSTNPTSTVIYNTLISLKAGNAIVLSPHPSAARCICKTASVISRAALSAGCPEGLIACMQHTTLAGTRELMSHREVGVILATGGTGLVRAAYSSGKPAYGVGPGNVPAFIERTADVRKAVADIFTGKTFDYGTICSSEQAIVVEEAIEEMALEECRRRGAYFLTAEEAQAVGNLVFQPGTHTPNTKAVGRPATTIAELAGFKVPPSTSVLIARLGRDQIGRAFPLSAEKLSPILAFYSVPNLAAGIELCQRLIAFGGLGHTCAIHSQNESAIRDYGMAMPAFRVCVNTPAVHGSIGYSTNLFPAMTLGCGAPGGNITSDNISPYHLMNIKRIAWGTRPVEHQTVPAERRLQTSGDALPPVAAPLAAPSSPNPWMHAETGAKSVPSPEVDVKDQPARGIDRSRIAKIVAQVLREYSEPQEKAASAVAPASSASSSSPKPSPDEIGAEFARRVFGPEANSAADAARATPSRAPAASPIPEPPPVPIAQFVSENDVRRAITKQEKLFIGPKTIVTPSARDLGVAHEVFVEVLGNSKPGNNQT